MTPPDPSHPEPVEPVARCYRHPMRETGVRCSRCNRPICPDCMRPASVGFHCPDDVRLANRGMRRPRTVVGAPVSRSDKPWVTYAIIALNVLVYVVTVVQSHNVNNPQGSKLFGEWLMNPFSVAHSDDYQRLITSAFLHLSVIHILLNMVALFYVGPFLEKTLGWWRFLALYLLAALGGSLVVYWFAAPYVPSAGASGAIYGLFAAALVMAHRIGLDLRALAGTIAINFLFTFTIPGISIEAHVGGFVFGGLAALAVVGLPAARVPRPNATVQVAGLSGLLVLIVVTTAVRTAVFPGLN